MSAPERLWTVVDVARFLAVSRSWVYQQGESGLLPHLRIAGLRFNPEEIQRWAATQNGRAGRVVVPLKGNGDACS